MGLIVGVERGHRAERGIMENGEKYYQLASLFDGLCTPLGRA